MGAAVKFLSAEFSREESKGSFAEGREDRVGNLAGLEKGFPSPPPNFDGNRLSRGAFGRRAKVLSLKLAINRVSWLSEGRRGGLIRLILGADLIIIRFVQNRIIS